MYLYKMSLILSQLHNGGPYPLLGGNGKTWYK